MTDERPRAQGLPPGDYARDGVTSLATHAVGVVAGHPLVAHAPADLEARTELGPGKAATATGRKSSGEG